ncbi:alpha/beta hydrolase family protein [Corynebacterium aquatimens]|uniref:Pimeloyl-ACP methyl ester carboxylesterase n=1 Tax=Corynebacterium aquatimens TaxID=1190508 RepID=A0A931E114_9CORY|nr:lipase family protein [Corynebacterium aquatimens]MBG6121791.1 pimeloyl-ACP methyl ester carboxylesterase [Corynebacterium aquatimens]
MSAVAMGVASAPDASAQSVQIVNGRPVLVADPGVPMRPVAPYKEPLYRSGLPKVAPKGKPGTVLAEVPLDPRAGLPNASKQYRIAYSTVDKLGKPAVGTAAVFIPKGPKPAGGWPVVAWTHGTVGLGDECAPSINARIPRDVEYLGRWLDLGYAIVAPDYVGLDTPGLHSYLNGKQSAVEAVDSVAALHNMKGTRDRGGSILAKKWAVIGQSQGGGVALHVAHRATERSTKMGLDYRGAIVTGAPAYIENFLIEFGPSFPPVPAMQVYGLYVLGAVREAYPHVDFDSALTDEGKRMIAAAQKSCYYEVEAAVRGVNLTRAFKKPLRSVPGAEQAIRDFMGTPVAGYDKPVFLGHGMTDVDVPGPIGVVLNSDMWLRQFVGSPRNNFVEVRWYPTDHDGTVNASTQHSVPFLARIMR